MPGWQVPFLANFVPRQRKALEAVALIRATTEKLIAKCRAMVDAEEQVALMTCTVARLATVHDDGLLSTELTLCGQVVHCGYDYQMLLAAHLWGICLESVGAERGASFGLTLCGHYLQALIACQAARRRADSEHWQLQPR